MTPRRIRLGVNIDHIATLREARYRGGLPGAEPDVAQAARAALRGGADSLTAHLREDRRHIQDEDVRALRGLADARLNLEMSIAPQIVAIACAVRPDQATLVPERRQELTTEGGLDAATALFAGSPLERAIHRLRDSGILVSLFIDPVEIQIIAASALGAVAVELHTGAYAGASGAQSEARLADLRGAAARAQELGLRVFAGHGLRESNVGPLCRLAPIEEFNIGHSLVAAAVFHGLERAVRGMRERIDRETR
ncbi:MAG: pyridoxine 5'-phosphate synthase [Planctomycetes bacterium]|nr:pyridoxine 5'-phosphate synthase [Planctomycetota bacterium]